MRRKNHRFRFQLDIPSKANKILNLILVGFLLIILRIWHLGFVQHDERSEEARRPQQKLVIEPSKRGTIRDRFNLPLAINKVRYNAAILYAQIKQIPSTVWETKDGKKVKIFRRREYIAKLAKILAEELQLEPERLEDLIHAKASLYTHHPYIIKEDLSEKEYYRLKMLEKDWVGIHTQLVPQRFYPLNKVAGDIIGYMGAISRDEYEKVIHEIGSLENYLRAVSCGEECSLPVGISSHDEVEGRLNDLIDHAYSLSDSVGKTGVEGRYEELLRGYRGKKTYFSDARGNFLRQLDGEKKAQSGQRILLTISSELQEYAENLLIQNESMRELRIESRNKGEHTTEKEPWIKGGAIVAFEPMSGDILAMASYPRYDPNDFISTANQDISSSKHRNIRRWLESEAYIGEIWDGKRPLERERYDPAKDANYEEQQWLTWENYMRFILPVDSPIVAGLQRIGTVKNAADFQKAVDNLLELTGRPNAYAMFNMLFQGGEHQSYKKLQLPGQKEALALKIQENQQQIQQIVHQIEHFFAGIPKNYDKVLLVDLCRLLVDSRRIQDRYENIFGIQTLDEYRAASSAIAVLTEAVKNYSKDLYHIYDFKAWRLANQREFLKQKRLEEQASGKRYASSYLEILDQKEKEMFEDFWDLNRWDFILAILTGTSQNHSSLSPYLDVLTTWHKELSMGAHQEISWANSYWKLRKALGDFRDEIAHVYLQSLRSFQELDRPLLGQYRSLRQQEGKQTEKHLAMAFYPTYGFGYGRSYAYRQAAPQGSIFKLVTAYEALVQEYNKTQNIGAGFLEIVDNTHLRGGKHYVGYYDDGTPIPQIFNGGRIPRSHRSGIGKVDLLRAFEVSSNPYFSLLASEKIARPSDLAEAAKNFSYGRKTEIDLPGEIKGNIPTDLDSNRTGLYAMAIGQHSLVVTPLQTAVMMASIANGGKILKPKIVGLSLGKTRDIASGMGRNQISVTPTHLEKEILMPVQVRELLLEGMRRVSNKALWASLGSLSKQYQDYPEAISSLIEMKECLIGKSSTAESRERLDLDLEKGIHLYNHVWFGGIVFDPDHEESERSFVFNDDFGYPELVVVVYLRFGAWGKDAAPLAAQIAQKWREIKESRL